MSYAILTDELIDQIDGEPTEEQARWLILAPSQEFPGYWDVDSLGAAFFYDLEEIVGEYSIVSPTRLEAFLERAKETGYEVVFTHDPQAMLERFGHLQDPPPVSLASTLEDTTRGFLPWQIVGFNKLVKDESVRAGMVVWDTGTGKSAFMGAAIKWHLQRGEFDRAVIVVKAHNRVETQRKLQSLAGLDSLVVGDVPKAQRFALYEEIANTTEPQVIITNYDKLRADTGVFDSIVRRKRCLFFWDEMPTKLGNDDTQLYESTQKMLYKQFASHPSPTWMRHWLLSATPIERDPLDVFHCMQLMHPYYLGDAIAFDTEYVAIRNPLSKRAERFRRLDKLEAKLDHITHRVSKADPEVAKRFPTVIRDDDDGPKSIDWNPRHRRIYDALIGKARDVLDEFEDANILALIQVMQMVCDAPSMVKASAENRDIFEGLIAMAGDLEPDDVPLGGPTGSDVARRLLGAVDPAELSDERHTKLEEWRKILLEKHPEAKVVTHSTWAGYIFPVWRHWLDQWGVSYVTYTGTDKQKQKALDSFREDPSIRAFLSGDSGSDSIDIPQASVGVNYNGPWKWTTEKQREGRRDRVDSPHKTIYTYTLSMGDSVEDRKREIRQRKYSYHAALFEGRAVESALSAGLTSDEFRYVLLGDPELL